MKVSELWTIIRYKLGWAGIILFTAIPVIWTIRLISLQGLPLDRFTLFSTFGLVEGVAGLMLYAINLILAVRLRVMEDYFGGLNRMYIAHHLTGGIALILLCFHPIALTVRNLIPITKESVRAAAEFLWFHPISFSRPISRGMAINFGLIALFGMVILLIITFFVKLRYTLWLFTHKFLGLAFFFAALHVLFIQGLVSDNAFLRWYLLFWCGLGLIAFVYRTLVGRILIRHYDYRVTKVTEPAEDVVSLSLTPINKRMDFEPGQFVFIRFKYSDHDGITTEAHPFSISSSPRDNELRLSVKALGDYTRDLLNIKPGTIAEIEGAYGKFSYKNYDNPNQIWIAGGIGITPFLSMARSIKEEHNLNVDLYYSVKKSEELIDVQFLNAMDGVANLHFNYIPFVAEKQGMLNADIIETTSKSLAGKDFYICGPPPMMKALRRQLRAKGVPNFRIHSEEFSMS